MHGGDGAQSCLPSFPGKIWLIFMILLRMVVILVAGSPVYQDEQERFVCNTLQPGCANVCYDFFSPVSHLRFWLVQSVSVFLPSAVFSVYVLHKGAELAARGPCRLDDGPSGQDPADRSPGNSRRPPPCGERRSLAVPDFSSGYTAHLCLRTLTEAAFAAFHYLLFGFSVPKRFSCSYAPCSGAVDCYVSRPTEKSILMLLLWALTALSVLLSLADLLCSACGWLRAAPGPAVGGLGSRPAPAVPGGEWEERAGLAHPGSWAGGHSAPSPRGQSAVSGRMELPDEDESEGLSSASDKLSRAYPEYGARPHREGPQDPSSEHPLVPSTPPAGTGSAPLLGTRRSEWV